MIDQPQMGIFPALLDPARMTARALIAEGETQGGVPDNPGFVVTTDENLVPGVVLTTFTEEGRTFFLIQL